jgi:hypothetical protein
VNRRIIFAALGAFAIGGVLVGVGWRIQGTDQFLPALLLELGASFFLVVPLLVFERLLSGRIERAREETEDSVGRVRQEVQETSRRLDALNDIYGQRQQRARAEDGAAVDAVRNDVSLENLHQLLMRAGQQRAISDQGVRVGLDHVTDRVRFRALHHADQQGDEPEPAIWIHLDDAEGRSAGGAAIWSVGEAVEDVWQRLVEESQRRNRYPGDGILIPRPVIERLLDSVERALALKSSPRGSIDVGPLIEFVGDWALTEQGLEHAGEPPYSIATNKLLEDAHLDDSMLDKTWVDGAQYRDAARVARAFHAARRRRRLPPPLGRSR